MSLVIQNVTKSFGSFIAVQDVSFTAEAGQIFGFLGTNGASKTTMRIILDILRPDAGSITWGGRPNTDVARVLAFVPFCSPLVMLTRIIVDHPTPWEVALSVLILIASIACFVTLAARIYRIGVLLYGTRPTLRTVFRMNHARVAR